MSKTKVVETKTGRKMYYVDGKLSSKAAYEQATKPKEQSLEDMYGGLGVTVEDKAAPAPTPKPEKPEKVNQPTTMPKPPEEKKCIFCGAFASTTKFVNMRTVRLCEDHYQEKTTGEIVAEVRKKFANEQTN